MLINCAAYENGVKLGDISTEAISDYIARPEAFVWVALRDATDAELQEMQEEFGLHDLAVEDARHGHQRPKIDEYGDSLFAVMHLVEMDGSDLRVGEVDVFVCHNYVLSVRSGNGHHFLGVRERCEREPDSLRQGAGFVFYALLDAVVDRYFPVIDALETELETIEDRIFEKGAARSNIERLYQLKRQVMVVKHAVAPLMEVVGKLYGGRVPSVCVAGQDYFRDVHDHLVRINAALEVVRETVGTAIQVSLSTVAIEQNDVNKRLAAWAGIFAVVTAFAGIWGMNFEYMPELKSEYGYPAALGVMLAVSGFLLWRFKRSGWL